MTRGEANNICVGDKVRTMGNKRCTVNDLKFVVDSDGNECILVTLTDDRTGTETKTNLELTTLEN